MAPALDREALNAYTMADLALQRELFDMFFDGAPAQITQLKADLHAGVITHWGAIGHTIKGTARSLGMTRLALAAIAVQDARRPDPALFNALIEAEAEARAAAAAYLDAADRAAPPQNALR